MWRGKDSNLRSRSATDLQSVPFDHSGTPPKITTIHDPGMEPIPVYADPVKLPSYGATKPPSHRATELLSWRRDSNPRPADYKSAALPTELRQRNPSDDRATRVVQLRQPKGLTALPATLPEIADIAVSGAKAWHLTPRATDRQDAKWRVIPSSRCRRAAAIPSKSRAATLLP